MRNNLYCIALFISLLFPYPATAVEEDDQTLSPYFVVTTEEDAAIDSLPLQSTRAEVEIAGVIANVVVTQTYKNSGEIPLEATYMFPGSTRAAVHGLQMKIGERVRRAVIKRKEKARAIYHKAKSEGKSASLLEQHRPNVFQMNIANIMPEDLIEVQLSYTELLLPTEGVYKFVYPTVVGPRYNSSAETGGSQPQDAWIQNPYTTEGVPPSYTFDIFVRLRTGLPIQKVFSASHEVDVRFSDEGKAAVELNPGDPYSGNRDFLLSYALSGETIESGLLLHEGVEENFFLLMAQPPKRVTPEVMPAREYIFVVDVSGSMNGFPLDVSKALLKELISSLRPQDRFNVVLFAAGSAVLSEHSLPGTEQSIQNALTLLSRQRGGGGTRLLSALERTLALPQEEQMSRSVVVVTDGYISAEVEAFELVRKNLGGANLFAFGIGSSVNRFLIEGLARAGGGSPTVITRRSEAAAAAARFRSYISSPVLTGIDVSFEQFDAYDVEPLAAPDLFAERPLIVFGKWRGVRSGTVRVAGLSGDGRYAKTFSIADVQGGEENGALRYLWARHKIAALSDYHSVSHNSSLVHEITELGLKYSLLTNYTSFVAVDERVRNEAKEGVSVKQPLPLPKGVSNLAVGSGAVPSVPEPEIYALLCIVGLLLFASARARSYEN